MPEILKHRNSNIETDLFKEMFNIYDLNKFTSVYLLSGIDFNSKSLFAGLSEDLLNKEKLVFIASTPDDYEKCDKHFKEFKTFFKKFKIKDMVLIDKRVTKYASIKHIETSDVIFLTGGNPITQMEFIKEYEIDTLIEGFRGVIIGLSAGSINLGKEAYCSKDEDFPETITYPGLGVVDITIDPHFEPNNKVQKSEFLKSNLNIIGLPESSFIKVDKYGMQRVFGEYYIKEHKKVIKKLDQ